MPRIQRLPPPPALPARSPAAVVAGEVEDRIEGLASASDPGMPRPPVAQRSPALEARVHLPPAAARVVVLCHPHPQYGGSMHSPVPLAIAKVLSEKAQDRVGWARFNFRGVGTSAGGYDGGRGEVDDVLAVIEHVRRRIGAARITLCGHSFGSWVALRAAGISGESVVDAVLLIAPSARLFAFGEDAGGLAGGGFTGHKTIFVGTLDDYCSVDEARGLAEMLGAELRVFEGANHHFLSSRRALAEAALPIVAPEAIQ
ncbi:MAG: alpha/beta fold hydrolase [Myxococcota bacterium]|nr:alpha/beta fold hydrolase [Myxococcota bacterium]